MAKSDCFISTETHISLLQYTSDQL